MALLPPSIQWPITEAKKIGYSWLEWLSNLQKTFSGLDSGSLLVETDSSGNLQDVDDLTDWIEGTTGEIAVADDGDGSVTLSTDPCYGSLYLHEGAINVDISAAGTGVYVKITGLTTGPMNNVTINSDAFNVDVVGVYKVDWQISADSQGSNLTYDADLFLNGVELNDGAARRKFGAADDYGSMSGTALVDITNTGHDLDLRMKEVGGAGTDIDIFNMSFNIVRIGAT